MVHRIGVNRSIPTPVTPSLFTERVQECWFLLPETNEVARHKIRRQGIEKESHTDKSSDH